MTDKKALEQRVALSRRRVAFGFISVLIMATVPTVSRAEEQIYERRPRRRRRRRCTYHPRRC